jgi:hypothetical protein
MYWFNCENFQDGKTNETKETAIYIYIVELRYICYHQLCVKNSGSILAFIDKEFEKRI